MVTVISFSSRENGNCSKILDFLRNNMEDVAAFSFADFLSILVENVITNVLQIASPVHISVIWSLNCWKL